MEGNIKSDFFIAISERVCGLKRSGINFSLTCLKDNGKTIDIGVIGKKTKLFTLSFEGRVFFLENPEEKKPGGRPTFFLEDMINYLLVLANDGPVSGKLTMPGTEEKIFMRVPIVSPT